MENTREYVKRVLEKYEFRTKKSLGQNFLVDDSAIDRIVSYVPKGATVLEIGPGIGLLTRKLIEKAGSVIAVEIDGKLCEILREEINSETLEVIEADFMHLDMDKILPKKAFVVANIPYYITTPIILKVLTSYDRIENTVLTIQKEVADKLVAGPGQKGYGILSLVSVIYGEPEVMFNIQKEAFIPQPKVESSVVRFNCKQPNLRVDEKDLMKVIKASFGKRRKTIVNSLSGLYGNGKDEFKQLLEKNGIDPMARPETLGIGEFEIITGIVFNKA